MKKLILTAALVAVLVLLCPSRAASRSAEDVAQYLMLEKSNQVVMLTPPSRHDTGGTGFELRTPHNKVITITNAHVCSLNEGGFMGARIPGTDRWVRLRILEVATTTDLCALESLTDASGLSLAEDVSKNAPVYALGHPLLEPLRVSGGNILEREKIQIGEEEPDASKCIAEGGTPKQVDGLFGSVQLCITSTDSMALSVVIYPGNSGSPLMNADGEVVGVIFAADRRTNQGFSIPLDVVRQFISVH